eukprot:TRINITY_DN15436_c0_g1_i4.p1 TRINITY_DN15436_c0_g1~~TRINITY_DN15436_c0_g1_i4.p1  ORF type:complete len:520 (+),score=135.19 TRINITY_DN15436_c0_g1_i4:90-1649(+)
MLRSLVGSEMCIRDRTETKYFCMCRRTKNPPFCDGSHARLPEDIEDLVAPPSNTTSGGAQSPGEFMKENMNANPTKEEPTLAYVKLLAREGLGLGHHGAMSAMGVPRPGLPQWDDIQLVVGQMASKPLLDDAHVSTELVIGPRANKPLVLAKPIFVSDMSFGSLSEESKVCLARGAELAGTGICSGEGGMLDTEQASNSRYFYELASAQFGFKMELLEKVQAFHFKGGQGAKTGTGGHLPGNKVTGKIAVTRGLNEGEAAISPATFPDLFTTGDFKKIADEVREVTGGIPIGFKLSAQHIEEDIQFALDASADYIIIDGRGGGTGAAPIIFRDNISVPTIPAIARARRYLDAVGASDVTLLATGGLRTPADFTKALCLGANGVGISNSALQSIGCVAARMCNTNMCPAGIATQDGDLRQRLDVEKGSNQLKNFLEISSHLMSVLARACGHSHLQQFNQADVTTWKLEMAHLTGIRFGGVVQPGAQAKPLSEQLAEIKHLHDSGALTDAEFERAKAKVLA